MEYTGGQANDREFDIASLGILVFDTFGKTIERFPEKGTSLFFDTLQMHPGGCAYNTGVDAARLGLKVAVLGKLGTDSFGDIIVQNLKNEGVDIRGVRRTDESNTAFSFIMIPDDGQRRIYTTSGIINSYGYQDIDLSIVMKSHILHIAGASLMPSLDGEPTVELLRTAQENGVMTSMDPVVKEGIENIIIPCLPYLDIFLPNSDESFYITGLKEPEQQLEFYLKAGVKHAGIKMGHKGCLISDGKSIYRFGVYDVPVVDTCGAGDAFYAGFLYGMKHKWDIIQSTKFATAAASFCIRSIGTTTVIPCISDVLDFIGSHELEYEICSF